MRTSRLATLAATAALALTTVSTGTGEAAPSSSPRPDYVFTSSPDFLNVDLGDVGSRPDFDGAHTSYDASYGTAVYYLMNQFRATGASDFLVAGDLVEGHWGMDTARTGTFGPTRTEVQKRAHVRAAARFYFTRWLRRWTARGMDVHPAVGDHDLGDNPWGSGTSGYSHFRQRNVELFRHQFSRWILGGNPGWHPAGPASGTAYAARLDPEVQLVSLDVFENTGSDVIAEVDDQQLAWVDRVLSQAQADGVDWIIVQGHTPIVGPVRKRSSSGLMYTGRANSRLWRTMLRHHVDLYLCGEVHDVTAIHRDGIAQISHGGAMQYGLTSWLTGRVTGDRMDLAINEVQVVPGSKAGRLWQSDGHVPAPGSISLTGAGQTGSMTLSRDNRLVGRSGRLAPYLAAGGHRGVPTGLARQ